MWPLPWSKRTERRCFANKKIRCAGTLLRSTPAHLFIFIVSFIESCFRDSPLAALPDKPLKPGIPQAPEHPLGVFPYGEGAHLHTVELVGGGLFRLDRLGLLLLLEGHTEVVADASGNGLPDEPGIFHDPL